MGDRQYLKQFRILETGALREAESRVGRVLCPHHLSCFSDASHPLAMVHSRADLGGIALNYIHYGAEVAITSDAPKNFYVLQIPLEGSADIRSGNQSIRSSPEEAAMLSPSRSVRMRWSHDCKMLLLQIEQDRVRRSLEAMLGRHVQGHIDFDLSFSVLDSRHATIIRMIDLLRIDLESASPLLSGGLAGRQIGEALIMALLQAQTHSFSSALEDDVPMIAPHYVKRAEIFMRENLTRSITMIDIAASVGVSVRALQKGFRVFRQSTPTEVLRCLRIDVAHTELLKSRPGDSVTDVALRLGFPHVGRFAGYYQSRVGEKPSETLGRGGL